MNLDTAVSTADHAGALEMLRLGADVNQRGPDGMTPLMIASGLGQYRMVEIFLTAKADVLAIEPRMGATALHKAAQSGNADVLGLLLDEGAFIDQQSPVLGHTALMDAVLHKHASAVKLLLKRGARTTIRNHWQQTALELAREDNLTTIANLIDCRNDADAEEVKALALVAAVKAGDLVEVTRLIDLGADVDEQLPVIGTLDDNYTPLGIAVREGHIAIVRALLNAGADPRKLIGLMRGTPVHEAAFFGRADVIQVFKEHSEREGASVIELDAQGPYNGLTPLHDAVWHGHLEAATALLEADAPLTIRTHAGLTAKELAALYGYRDLVFLLLDAEKKRDSSRVPGSSSESGYGQARQKNII
jgi:ankyrin repeat protein